MKCKCELCKRGDRVRKAIRKGDPVKLIKVVFELKTALFNAECDRDYYYSLAMKKC